MAWQEPPSSSLGVATTECVVLVTASRTPGQFFLGVFDVLNLEKVLNVEWVLTAALTMFLKYPHCSVYALSVSLSVSV